MPANSHLFKKYLNNSFIETGSHIGRGIDNALIAGFKKIYSIELAEKHYNYCINKFKNNSNIKLFLGDSSILLKNVLCNINEKTTIFLDSHYSGGDTALGKKECPLMEELEIIKNHNIKNHIIIIDDIRCWNKENKNIGFGLEDLKNKILEINKNYNFILEDSFQDETFLFKDDLLVAFISD